MCFSCGTDIAPQKRTTPRRFQAIRELVEPWRRIATKFLEGIGNTVADWLVKLVNKLEVVSVAILLTPVVLLMLFTEEGNRIRETPVGAIVFWSIVVLIGLNIFLAFFYLMEQRGWFYHLFMLSLIVYFYYFKDDEKVATWVAAFYGASIFLPQLWQDLSDELAEKVARKLEERSKNKEKHS